MKCSLDRCRKSSFVQTNNKEKEAVDALIKEKAGSYRSRQNSDTSIASTRMQSCKCPSSPSIIKSCYVRKCQYLRMVPLFKNKGNIHDCAILRNYRK